MSGKIDPRPSHGCDTHRRTNATPPSHERDTGSSYKKSYSLISCRGDPHDPLGEITGEVEIASSASRSRSRPGARFLKGPVPLDTLAVAASLPGKALALYLILRHRCDLEARSSVSLPSELLQAFGIDRDAKARALRALEGAGLIQVERASGRAARITLRDPAPAGARQTPEGSVRGGNDSRRGDPWQAE